MEGTRPLPRRLANAHNSEDCHFIVAGKYITKNYFGDDFSDEYSGRMSETTVYFLEKLHVLLDISIGYFFIVCLCSRLNIRTAPRRVLSSI